MGQKRRRNRKINETELKMAMVCVPDCRYYCCKCSIKIEYMPARTYISERARARIQEWFLALCWQNKSRNKTKNEQCNFPCDMNMSERTNDPRKKETLCAHSTALHTLDEYYKFFRRRFHSNSLAVRYFIYIYICWLFFFVFCTYRKPFSHVSWLSCSFTLSFCFPFCSRLSRASYS